MEPVPTGAETRAIRALPSMPPLTFARVAGRPTQIAEASANGYTAPAPRRRSCPASIASVQPL